MASSEFETELAKKFKSEYLKNPKVTVTILQFRPLDWTTGARFGYVRTQYVDSSQINNAWLAGANVTYEFWRNLGITLLYQYESVASNVAGQSFNQHLVSLGADDHRGRPEPFFRSRDPSGCLATGYSGHTPRIRRPTPT
jgi:hypothetical protein